MLTSPSLLRARIKFGQLLPFFLFLALFISSAEDMSAQNQKPNIIFILDDDIGYEALHVNGGRSYSTPNLDSMTHNGMNFTECHATPLCSTTRQTLLTGKYNFRNYTKWGVMDTSQRTIANMLHDAGYKTACFGKWQLAGGDVSIKKFGFDEYCIFNPFGGRESRYKNPEIYTQNAFAPDSLTNGKYGEDIFEDSVMNFMARNTANPFFIYYPMALTHAPFQPTPDDSDFAAWSLVNKSDTSYFPSMVKYMDKKVGEILNKLKELGIDNNTLVIYVGDNGTPSNIYEYIDNDDDPIKGGKASTTEFGTHVPMIAYWPNTISPGTVNNDLIDFSDFLPTFAEVAGIDKPTTYGPLDGISFSQRLTGGEGNPRTWTFYHYDPHPDTSKFYRWAQTTKYKLYDTSSAKPSRLFFNIQTDINEKNPIPDDLLTPEEDSIKQILLNVINGYVAQGAPLLSQITLEAISDSSVTLKDSILVNGGSTITLSGFVWSTSANPTISSLHITDTICHGAFANTIFKLTANKTYYVRAYAINYAGISYSNQISFKTLYHPPVATTANSIDSNHFTANWNPIPNVKSYELDVSEYPSFSIEKTFNASQGFDNGLTVPTGWTFSKNIITDSNSFGKALPSLVFNASNASITTESLNGYATQLKFWIKGLNTKYASALLVEGFNGTEWIPIRTYKNLPQTGSIKTLNATSNPPLPDSIVQFRFTYTKSGGILAIDDISINYKGKTGSYVKGFNNITVKINSKEITGLKTGTEYYYRIRAVNAANMSSDNSNVVETSTCKKPVITNLSIDNLICGGSNTGAINVTDSGSIGTLAYNWTSDKNYTSSNRNIDSLYAGTYSLTITANGGCAVDTSVVITEPSPLNSSIDMAPITCSGDSTTLTITASGGKGNYHYTLSDGINIVGPQDDNHFTVAAGNYTVTVEDDNHCSFTASSVEVDAPAAIDASAVADPILCSGSTTTLTVTATGGTGNYHYTLFDGTNTVGPQDGNYFTVAAGNYTVTVEDDNHCSFTASSVEVDAPAAIDASAVADPITCSGSTTTLTVTATGGTGNYHYTLSDGTNTVGPQDDNHFIVAAGNYTVTVNDDNGCRDTTNLVIEDSAQPCNGIVSVSNATNRTSEKIRSVTKSSLADIQVYPNPTLNQFTLQISSSSTKSLHILITNTLGQVVYKSNCTGNSKNIIGKEFRPGIYFIQVMEGKKIKTFKLIKEK